MANSNQQYLKYEMFHEVPKKLTWKWQEHLVNIAWSPGPNENTLLP
jgi:hypothetical protein